ncbi:hypothetical protein C8J57DRAFT_1244020 [Mycena rebaudengoi]|nr:hypothetical protein C8J57DRAFT_1244020 [Mycena rebaudengoi]
MSDEQNTMLATSLNLRPHTSQRICEACTQPTPGPLMQCQNGSVLSNWSGCVAIPNVARSIGKTTPTTIGSIPENVAIRFTLKKSAEEVGTSLLCNVSCLTSKNERRRANKECSQKSADPRSDEDVTVIRRTFARPLDEGYAKNYISRNRQLLDANAKMEATQKLKDLATNSVHVVLWIKVNYPPQHFKLINSQPGKFIPQEHTIIMAAAEWEAAGLSSIYQLFTPALSGLCTMPALEFLLLISERIRRRREAEEIISPLSDTPRCFLVYSESDTASPALSSSSTWDSSSEPSSSSKSSPAPQEYRETTEDKREIKPLPFPFKYACDMEPGMRALSALRKPTQRLGLPALESGFRAQPSFKNCRFKYQTVYKHLRTYNRAVAASLSLSGDTKWSDIVKQVDALKTVITDPVVIEDDDGPGFDVKNMKREYYRVRAVDIDLVAPGVEVLETFSFCEDDNIYLAQSWECGSRFFVNTWGSDLSMHAPNQLAVGEILTAFSHFTYQHNNHRSVFVDFEAPMNMTMMLCGTPSSKVLTLKESKILLTATSATEFATLELNSIPLIFPLATN